LLTAQFIQNSVSVEGAHLGAATAGGLVQFLDPALNPTDTGLSPEAVAAARTEVFEHLKSLPDILLVSVYARDGHIVWSTNGNLIGTYATGKAELKEAFGSRFEVAGHPARNVPGRDNPHFVVQPRDLFIESYVPLTNAHGEVVLVAEVYKEPSRQMTVIRRGETLVWCTTLAGGALIYLGLFSIIRRASVLLARQQRQLNETESLVFAGEMTTALAHGLRNPLASVRSSAELALITGDLPVCRSAQDIITRVDFLAKWVRDLLVYSRPPTGEPEAVDLCAVLTGVLDGGRAARQRRERAHAARDQCSPCRFGLSQEGRDAKTNSGTAMAAGPDWCCSAFTDNVDFQACIRDCGREISQLTPTCS
jgi:two-component system sensor histidine kinase HydH